MKPVKKEMLVTGQDLQISNTPQVDPEGQQAIRRFRLEAQAGAQQTGAGGLVNQQGTIPALVQYQTTVGEMAQAKRTACASCKHFDQKAWRQFVMNATGPAANPAWKQTIETMRTRIAMAGYGYEQPDGGVDLDATLMAHGICRVLSDWVEGAVGRDPVFWPVVPWREATCHSRCRAGPHELPVVTAEQPYGLYQPSDLEAKKVGATRYDQVMRMAQGKTPSLAVDLARGKR